MKNGAIARLPEYVKQYGATKAFIVADVNIYPIVGEKVCRALEKAIFPAHAMYFR